LFDTMDNRKGDVEKVKLEEGSFVAFGMSVFKE
jgi:hypothetical protein